jgi:hypothetical protein
MAIKQFYATGAFKYNNRMLTAGDPVEMDGPTSRFYIYLNKISPTKPRTITSLARPDADGSGNLLPTAAPKPKRAPRKRAAKKSK